MSLQNELVSDSIGTDTENVSNQIDTNSELQTEKPTRMRGPDRKPRRFNPKSLQNLKQYQTIPAFNSDVAYPPSRINVPKIVLAIIIGLILAFVVWKIISEIRKERELEN